MENVLTVEKNYHTHNMLAKICLIMKVCAVFQRTKIKLNTDLFTLGHIFSMESLTVDIDFMPKNVDDLKYLLVAKYEITSLVLSIQIKEQHTVAEALIHAVICIFGPSELLILENESAFPGKVTQFILRAINYKLKIISHSNIAA